MIASRKPEWLKIMPPTTESFQNIKQILAEKGLHTVCEEAHCPNISECWSGGTATFMVMGSTCTRACRFCAVKNGLLKPLDPEEPRHLAEAIAEMGLEYAVITSVDRDDLPDQGSAHFAACVNEIRRFNPKIMVEALIPDFRGSEECIQRVVLSGPDVIAHNIETVERLQQTARDRRANYRQSLNVLGFVKKLNPDMRTKSSIMVGLGETEDEVIKTMRDLKNTGVDILTIGQYLRPSGWHLSVGEYVHPEKFESYKKAGEGMGFLYVASGPFVRSSYKAAELFAKALKQVQG